MITTRSTGTNWLYTLTPETNSAAGTISVSGDLQTDAAEGTWTIDPSASPALNRAFRDWQADFFSALHARCLKHSVSARALTLSSFFLPKPGFKSLPRSILICSTL